MQTFADRVKHVRKTVRKMSQTELANCAGCSQGTIAKIEAGNAEHTRYLNRIATCLNVTANYLETGADELSLDDSTLVESSIKDSVGHVPLIAWVQAGETQVAFTRNIDQYGERIKVKRKHSRFSYALEVRGSSMTAPEGAKYSFPEGYVIVVDPEQRGDNTDGIFVIAKEEGADAVTFKQLKYDGGKPYLNPLNPAYPKIFKPFRILGKVIDWDANLPDLP
jgi:SOS-response transcriptional repressor LexA